MNKHFIHTSAITYNASQYHDQLMEDMGLPKNRKGTNALAEWYEPYSAADYADVFDPSLKRSDFKVSSSLS